MSRRTKAALKMLEAVLLTKRMLRSHRRRLSRTLQIGMSLNHLVFKVSTRLRTRKGKRRKRKRLKRKLLKYELPHCIVLTTQTRKAARLGPVKLKINQRLRTVKEHPKQMSAATKRFWMATMKMTRVS
jgi:hypothetical protein